MRPRNKLTSPIQNLDIHNKKMLRFKKKQKDPKGQNAGLMCWSLHKEEVNNYNVGTIMASRMAYNVPDISETFLFSFKWPGQFLNICFQHVMLD